MTQLCYLYLLAPLHTGGTTQEGNLLGIARESHTQLPYVPSSSIRGRLRASVTDQALKYQLFGNEIESGSTLEQGDIWVGDGSLLWLPVPSLSHGIVWVSSPLLIRRWLRATGQTRAVPPAYATSIPGKSPLFLRDAILQPADLQAWADWQDYLPAQPGSGVDQVLVMPDAYCATLVEASLWRQVKVKLDANKTVEGGFRYEEAIPPDTLMWFPWGTTSQARQAPASAESFRQLLTADLLQIGGQESLGRGFVQPWLP